MAQDWPAKDLSKSLNALYTDLFTRTDTLQNTFAGDTSPTDPVLGQLFFNTTDNLLYKCTDATTPTWEKVGYVEDGSITVSKLALASGSGSVNLGTSSSGYISVPNYAHVHEVGSNGSSIYIGGSYAANRWYFHNNDDTNSYTVYMGWHIHSSSPITLPFWVQLDQNNNVVGHWVQASHYALPTSLVKPPINGQGIMARIDVDDKFLSVIEPLYDLYTLNSKYDGIPPLGNLLHNYGKVTTALQEKTVSFKMKKKPKVTSIQEVLVKRPPTDEVEEEVVKSVSFVKLTMDIPQ